MDVRVEEVRPPLLPSRFPGRRRGPDGTSVRGQTLARRSLRTLTASQPARWEWAVAVFALLVLGRLTVLFFRQHLTGLFGEAPQALWQEDRVVAMTFAFVELTVVGVAIWRARTSALLRQPLLLALLGWAWLSMAWSVEPAISARRALLFAGTAGVGWYIGARFSFRDHMRVLAALGGVALGASVAAVFVWDQAARNTPGLPGAWSGIYVNRNALGLVLSLALVATMMLIRTTERRFWMRCYALVLFLAIGMTRSKTGLVGALVALTVAALTYEIRKRRSNALRVGPAAYVVFATLATLGLVVHWYWYDLLRALGRDPDLTGRTLIWQLVGWFSDLHPWTGWGFEAIWANGRAIGQAQAANGSLKPGIRGGWPFSAHNGYYEVMLGLGRVGLLLLVLLLGTIVWRAFRHAWAGYDTTSLWPLTFIVFAIVVNFSESLFVSNEAVWAMTVATAVGLREHAQREGIAGLPLRERVRQLLAFRLG